MKKIVRWYTISTSKLSVYISITNIKVCQWGMIDFTFHVEKSTLHNFSKKNFQTNNVLLKICFQNLSTNLMTYFYFFYKISKNSISFILIFEVKTRCEWLQICIVETSVCLNVSIFLKKSAYYNLSFVLKRSETLFNYFYKYSFVHIRFSPYSFMFLLYHWMFLCIVV